jgi:hypothetical protein
MSPCEQEDRLKRFVEQLQNKGLEIIKVKNDRDFKVPRDWVGWAIFIQKHHPGDFDAWGPNLGFNALEAFGIVLDEQTAVETLQWHPDASRVIREFINLVTFDGDISLDNYPAFEGLDVVGTMASGD